MIVLYRTKFNLIFFLLTLVADDKKIYLLSAAKLIKTYTEFNKRRTLANCTWKERFC